MNKLYLTHDEEESVMKVLSQYPLSHHTVDSLFDEWSKFIDEIERGYTLSIYDYTNDLSVREMLQEIIDGVPSLQEKLIDRLKPLDERFIDLTKETRSPELLASKKNLNYRFYRVPKKLIGELKDDLISEKILDSGDV